MDFREKMLLLREARAEVVTGLAECRLGNSAWDQLNTINTKLYHLYGAIENEQKEASEAKKVEILKGGKPKRNLLEHRDRVYRLNKYLGILDMFSEYLPSSSIGQFPSMDTTELNVYIDLKDSIASAMHKLEKLLEELENDQ